MLKPDLLLQVQSLEESKHINPPTRLDNEDIYFGCMTDWEKKLYSILMYYMLLYDDKSKKADQLLLDIDMSIKQINKATSKEETIFVTTAVQGMVKDCRRTMNKLEKWLEYIFSLEIELVRSLSNRYSPPDQDYEWGYRRGWIVVWSPIKKT